MDRLLAALKRKRHGQRDWLIGLLIYRHGLRVSEARDLRWDDVDLNKRTITLRRLKGSNDSTWSGTNSPASRRSNAERARSAVRPYRHRSHGRLPHIPPPFLLPSLPPPLKWLTLLFTKGAQAARCG